MRHLDQSVQRQSWLILFIVAALTVPVDTERHEKHNRGLLEGNLQGRGRWAKGGWI